MYASVIDTGLICVVICAFFLSFKCVSCILRELCLSNLSLGDSEVIRKDTEKMLITAIS